MAGNAFADIYIQHDGITCECEFVALLTAKLRTKITGVQWRIDAPDYKISQEGNLITKETLGWLDTLHSTTQITQPLTYFQMKILCVSPNPTYTGGIYYGVTKGNSTKFLDDFEQDNMIRICNSSFIGKHVKSTEIFDSVFAEVNDVIGVVVNLHEDVVRFYVNGKNVARSAIKPSTLSPLYAFVTLYYKGCELLMGEYIPYDALETVEPNDPETKSLVIDLYATKQS